MLLRLLTLVLLLISTSGCEGRRGVEVRDFDVNCQEAMLEDSNDDYDIIRDCTWVGIISTDEAPALRTPARQRTSQRNFEKRKLVLDALTKVAVVNKTFKIFRNERQTYCHYEKSGRSLLHFLCKLSI
ncbi:MAG: hypothetical protein J6T60_10290 [Bacteroidales bacterium]|nr:hypothetical protein [Bacteroidales bacterium]